MNNEAKAALATKIIATHMDEFMHTDDQAVLIQDAIEENNITTFPGSPLVDFIEDAMLAAIAEIAEAAARRAEEASEAAVAIVSGASQSSMDNSTKDINDEEVDALLNVAVSIGELEASSTKSDTAPKSANQAPKRDSEDDLALRFAALKKPPR